MPVPSKVSKKLQTRQRIKNTILVALGILSASFGLKGFLIPNGFIDGGVIGISLLTSHLSGWNLSLLILAFSIPFIILGYKQISPYFSMASFIAILALAITVHFIEFPIITNDKLLIAVFGGFFLGTGSGLAIRGGCVIDGTEILAVYLNRSSAFSIGDIILIINILIFSTAAIFLGLEPALYSILTYLSAAKTIDFIIHGLEEYMGVTIISIKSQEIRDAIIKKMGRGVTIYKAERGFGSDVYQDKNIDIVFTVVTRLEITKIKAEVEQIDPRAFIVTHRVDDTKGGMVKKRALH